ncbi:hypothetical protein EV426DRAFT_538931 [Tirmania nivea]|nr:hypothetical protein EV426DRAFT_538931 [Tirmania nivea]
MESRRETRCTALYNCPFFFYMPQFSPSLVRRDQVSSTLHELTHFKTVYSPKRADIKYKHRDLRNMNTPVALQNANSYVFLC